MKDNFESNPTDTTHAVLPDACACALSEPWDDDNTGKVQYQHCQGLKIVNNAEKLREAEVTTFRVRNEKMGRDDMLDI